MKFKFPLQRVLDHRHIVQDLAQKDFQEAQAELLKQTQLLERMQVQLHEAHEEVSVMKAPASTSMPAKWQQIHEFTILQARRIEAQKAKVEEAEKLVEDKREILRLKAIDSKIIERLKERQRQDYFKERKITEQKEVDELNILRFESKDGE